MEIIQSNINELKKLKPRKFLEQVFSLVIIVGSALALWKTLVLGFNTECPVVVVLTGSMEPGYYRGDILFVYFFINAGRIGTSHQSQATLSCTIQEHNKFLSCTECQQCKRGKFDDKLRADGNLYILTKGDNNRVDDRGLYPPGVKWLHREEIMGKMRAYLPYMGMFTIWLNDYPMFKFAVLGLMGFFVLIAKDPQ